MSELEQPTEFQLEMCLQLSRFLLRPAIARLQPVMDSSNLAIAQSHPVPQRLSRVAASLLQALRVSPEAPRYSFGCVALVILTPCILEQLYQINTMLLCEFVGHDMSFNSKSDLHTGLLVKPVV